MAACLVRLESAETVFFACGCGTGSIDMCSSNKVQELNPKPDAHPNQATKGLQLVGSTIATLIEPSSLVGWRPSLV